MNPIKTFIKEYKPELKIIFWPSILFTVVLFTVYFYFCWNVEGSREEDVKKRKEEKKKRKKEGMTRDEKEALKKLYDDGQREEAKGNIKEALSCYLGAIHSINQCYDGLSMFPDTMIHCIKRVTVLCKASGEYDMALQFLQAEKFLYEHALVNTTAQNGQTTTNKEKKEDSVRKRKKNIHPIDRKNEFANQRAEALEKLSDMLLKNGKVEMAVNYASKALQVRQQVSQDEATADMNQFIKAYAELGRETYKKNLEWYQKVQEDTDKLEEMVEEMNRIQDVPTDQET
mmetsp:Transcript_9174/g.13574  ORF Transcript_9174/g.13574 Transcript_9174/m.13574 type:complete len:286 (+) Transcript_9174:98-955(+)